MPIICTVAKEHQKESPKMFILIVHGKMVLKTSNRALAYASYRAYSLTEPSGSVCLHF